MHLPNYKDGSIVNLMSSIKKALGGKALYKPLKGFDVTNISKKNIIFITIDGLGYEYLIRYGKGSIFLDNLKMKITSTFPSSTSAAMVSLETGLAPQQHGFMAWYTFFKEIGMIVIPLPFKTKSAGNISLEKRGIEFRQLLTVNSFFKDLNVKSFLIKHKNIFNSSYSKTVGRGAKLVAFTSLRDCFSKIKKIIKNGKGRKFLHVYWEGFDSICHQKWSDSREAKKHFDALNRQVRMLAKSLKNTNTAIIITADHGLIDTKEENKIIDLKKHTKLLKTLALPLCGEPRFIYFYVRPSKIKQFEKYIKVKMAKYGDLYKSKDLIKKNYFGLFRPNDNLQDRIGDYVFIMKKNFIIRELLLGEETEILKANHGGLSKEEMFVPLIVINQ